MSYISRAVPIALKQCLNYYITDILGWMIPYKEGCTVHYKMVSIIPGLYLLDALPDPVVTIKTHLQVCSMSPNPRSGWAKLALRWQVLLWRHQLVIMPRTLMKKMRLIEVRLVAEPHADRELVEQGFEPRSNSKPAYWISTLSHLLFALLFYSNFLRSVYIFFSYRDKKQEKMQSFLDLNLQQEINWVAGVMVGFYAA